MASTFLKTRYWALIALFLLTALPALYGQASLTTTETADTGGTLSIVAPVGQSIGFTIAVTNNGSASANNVAMSEALPNPAGAVNWSINATTGSPTCSISGSAPYQTLNCSEAVLAAGNQFTVHVTSATTTASAGIYDSCATASASGLSPVQGCSAISVIGSCTLAYPYGNPPALTSVVFNEAIDLVAAAACNANGCGEPVAGPNDWVALWYTDEHAMTLGVRQIAVQTSAGTTTTNYNVTSLSTNPDVVTNPQVGATQLGNNLFFPNASSQEPQGYPNNQEGTDTATWNSTYYYLDSSRPLWPALFLSDITGNPTSFSGDYQQGGTNPQPPSVIFGTWKAAVQTVDQTQSPYAVTVTPDSDPSQNNWTLGSGSDTPPGGFSQYASQGYGTEVRWNINQLTMNGQPLNPGHVYRLQIMVHDGDQNKSGGDTGEACINVVMSGNAGLTLFCPAANTGYVNIPYNSQFVATNGTPVYSYSIISGQLPFGLSLNPATGAITGTPTTAGTFNFTGQVVDSAGNVATVSCSITIAVPQPPSLACPPVTTGTVGQPYSSSLSVTGGVAPYTFSISSGSLPSGLSLNPATGAITGTPTSSGNYSFTAKVVDSARNDATVSCSINIAAEQPLHLACPSGPGANGGVDTPYSASLTATGGFLPYTFSIASGSLPPGLSLNPSTGAITGTPTTAGNYTFTAKVVDSAGNSATVNCSINIAALPPLTLACPSGPAGNGTVGTAYTADLTATGGLAPYTFSIVSGSLPPGLSLDTADGAIVGTPTTAGNYTFTAKVVDSNGDTATVSCSITIAAPPPISLKCPSNGPPPPGPPPPPPATNGTVGQAYSASLTATGGIAPYTFSISSGSLPPGLTLNATTGAITGTPTTAGNYSFTAKVVDSVGDSATVNCSITVAAPPPLTLACPGGPAGNGTVGTAYGSSLSASGGISPYTFSISGGALPPGLTLNSATGAITGTPTTVGNYTFTAKVVDSAGNSATVNCSINVTAGPPPPPPPPLSLTCPSNTGTVGQPYSSSLTATGGTAPYTFSISSGSLPPGLSLNASTGAINGTPTTAGNYTFTAKVVDSSNPSNTATVNCSINVVAAPLSLLCPPASSGDVGQPYSSSLSASGGTPPYTFSISSGSLPPGLSLNSSTGAITGTPTTAGNYGFTAKVVDSHNPSNTATATCNINIAPALSLQCPPVTSGMVGHEYGSALAASGGVSPYTFSISSGSLPPGLSLNTSTGAITGTPTASGNYNFTAKVVDSTGNSATATCSINITSQLSLLCPSVNSGTVGQPYSSSLTATGGYPPYTFSISSGSLPPGLSLNTSTGAITGTPATSGNYSFTAKVVDSAGNSATATCSINVTASQPLALACPPVSSGTVQQPYSSALTATGGVAPYTFSIVSGSLPTGLTLNPSTGAITGTASTQGTFNFTAKVVDSAGNSATATCSIVINQPAQPLASTACNPPNAVSLMLNPSTVTAYVPNGNWLSSQTGIQVVPIEPAGGTPTSIPTAGVVNTCSSDSTTGETACVDNNTDVYLINGSTLTATLTSGSTATAGFSGGYCYNCSVGVDATSNSAFIAMGLANSPSGSGYQFLNLANNSFGSLIPTYYEVAEEALWDPIRSLLVSPDEAGVFDLFQIQSGSLTEYSNTVGGTLDSAGEECETGIALATTEYQNNLVLTDLTQVTFTPGSAGSPGTWSAPLNVVTIPEYAQYQGSESGTDGIAIAQGTHLGLVIGEYPFPPSQANAVIAIQLPSVSGSGTPQLQDYAVATLPNDPAGYPFSVGCDPHTVSAYVSPSTGKAMTVVTDYGPVACYNNGAPLYIALIDIQGMLNAPRVSGTHTVDPNYDLVGNGVVTFLPTN